MYYLIGDINGHATELETQLQKLDYHKNKNGIYQHPSRKVLFAGDFIDRGPVKLPLYKFYIGAR